MNTRVDAGIVAVTVYPGQARVTRRGGATVEAGQRRVVVGGLPLALREDSVRVNGTGAGTVLGVDVTAYRAAIDILVSRRWPFEELPRRAAGFDEADNLLQTMAGEIEGDAPVHAVLVP